MSMAHDGLRPECKDCNKKHNMFTIHRSKEEKWIRQDVLEIT
ncbi:hypothetical protein LCGC14_1681670 [marine sediment metagenome]|uniref:Uncharacterized protein n=1 Tax=marine sediment metagenome TaxID=412755 RepID=A0A0F9K3X2_9ZZZZ